MCIRDRDQARFFVHPDDAGARAGRDRARDGPVHGQGVHPQPGAARLSEVLYAFMSAANNNGSAFAGLSANTGFYNTALGVAMLAGRFIPIVFVLGLAGSLARQRSVPATAGTLPTHRLLFVAMLY